MNLGTTFTYHGTCALLWLLILMVSTNSLPAQRRAEKTQGDVTRRERRSTRDIELAQELFNLGNSDGDNYLSSSEIRHFYEVVIEFPPNLAIFMAAGFLRNGDSNGDRLLDYAETLHAIRAIEG